MRMLHFIKVSILMMAAIASLLSVSSCGRSEEDAGLFFKPICFSSLMTRGAELTTSTLTSFKVTAFIDDEYSTEFMKDQEVVLNEGNWIYSPIKYWPHEKEVNFLAYSTSLNINSELKPEFVKVGDEFQAKFDYTLPSPDNSVSSNDADNQPDIIFALQTGRTEDDGTVSFLFSHALTAIQFRIGSVLPNTTLERIEFFKVRNSATCTVSGTGSSDISYSWELSADSQKIDYIQTFEPSVPLNEGMKIPNEDVPTTFMMIPQVLDEYAHLRLYINVDGVQQTRQLSLKGTTWNANEIHTYTISLN